MLEETFSPTSAPLSAASQSKLILIAKDLFFPASIRGRRRHRRLFLNSSCPRSGLPCLGPKAKAILERDAKYISPSYTRSYPLVMERGYGPHVEDVDGNTFLDFNAGVAVSALGHAHPKIAEAIADQASPVHTHIGHRLLLPSSDRSCREAEPGYLREAS